MEGRSVEEEEEEEEAVIVWFKHTFLGTMAIQQQQWRQRNKNKQMNKFEWIDWWLNKCVFLNRRCWIAVLQ